MKKILRREQRLSHFFLDQNPPMRKRKRERDIKNNYIIICNTKVSNSHICSCPLFLLHKSFLPTNYRIVLRVLDMHEYHWDALFLRRRRREERRKWAWPGGGEESEGWKKGTRGGRSLRVEGGGGGEEFRFRFSSRCAKPGQARKCTWRCVVARDESSEIRKTGSSPFFISSSPPPLRLL